MYAVSDAAAERIADAAARGATVVIGPLSGIADEENRVRLGGYPGAFRELLGVLGEELHPLQEGDAVALSSGAVVGDWAERLRVVDADVVDRYASGVLAGEPAITRRTVGDGSAWYVSGLLIEGFDDLVDAVVPASGVGAVVPVVDGVEAVRRVGPTASWLVLINHSDVDARVPAVGVDLVSGDRVDGDLALAAGAVAVVREDPTS